MEGLDLGVHINDTFFSFGERISLLFVQIYKRPKARDPLSHFLFTIVAEALSSLLMRAKEKGFDNRL